MRTDLIEASPNAFTIESLAGPLLWPASIWLHGATDALVALAVLAIPIALLVAAARRRDPAATRWLRWFALLVAACGAAHGLRLWTMSRADRQLDMPVEIATAALSLVTAALAWWLLTRRLTQSSSSQLREVNEALRAEITRRRGTEAQLRQVQKMEAVSRLADGIAHDFNNILQVIEGSLTLIEQRCDDDPQTGALTDGALAAVERGARLTRQLLTFSEVHVPAADLVAVPELAAQLKAPIVRLLPRHIELEWQGAEQPLTVRANRTRLELAIINLVINAREAMPTGGVLRIGFERCHVEARTDLRDGDYLCITVADTGIGMTPEVKQRAFEPFFSTRQSNLSPGLGLSIVYGVARQSGGTTSVQSAPAEGTTVTLYLRLAGADEVAARLDPPPAADPVGMTAALAGRRILVVDDEGPTRNIVATSLETLGCVVRQAESGMDALAQAAREWPDLFLLDYGMDGMNGADLAAALRRERPDCRIVFLTGFADSAAIEQAVGAAAVVLNKPVSVPQLARTLERAFAA